MMAWDRVTRADVLRVIKEYDRLGLERFFSKSPSGHFILRPRALQFDVASAGSSRE